MDSSSDGAVLIRRGDDYVDAETGQAVFEDIVRIDRVFKPFELGGGRVPDLLTSSIHTNVHPARLGGTPALTNHRIPARGIARLQERRGWNSVREAYPDIDETLLEDASEVGRALLAKR